MTVRPVPAAAAVLAVVALLGAVFYVGRCTADDYNPDQPPAILSGSSTRAAVEDEGPVEGLDRLTTAEASPTRTGRSDPLPDDAPERRAAERYAVDVLAAEALPLPDGLDLADPLPPPGDPGVLPLARFMRDDDAAAVSALDSRGAWQRVEYRCPDGRRFEGGTLPDGSGFYGNCERAVPGLLAGVARTALVCGATAAAGAAVAAVAGYERPEYAAGVAGGACVLIRLVD